MHFQLTHITQYEYQGTVSFCQNVAILQPRYVEGQELIDFKLEIEPKPQDLSPRIDFFGNTLHSFSIQRPHEKLIVTARSIIERNLLVDEVATRVAEAVSVTVEELKLQMNGLDKEVLDAKQYLYESPLIHTRNPKFLEYALKSFRPDRSVYEASFELMTRIFTDFDFVSGVTDSTTPTDKVFVTRKGVCQDFAQVAISLLRSVGIPARYVSGYIETLPPEGEEKLVGADASHAWFSVFIPGHGWFDFDPTNNQVPHNQYIILAIGRDYSDIVPFKGVIYSSGSNRMSVSVDLRQVEPPAIDAN